ncbi:hypothetical protein ABIF38_004750 [Bradyrhizobium japonicum]|uniref:Uncharacterized protein n=2 Tax=Bradyrhizobium elkanii TaxID=29448 RepID=A0ABV4F6P5_BRAEL|nr:hypothetical protein [Bradyrhizobium elkanii]MBP2433675.1 hypothetical protein [Bradyrhizobium elkanii]MCP1732939.1 hypothetical protein [Bradyrhizobium elkanii]MCP1750519.1 hypothetical protein [Bradyrhizobium elkanii]MCP1972673.1 hypothetical protein [Bradyrhizobium elkanii]MCP1976294.1 hypothetical protein [Bradyrhizobium elkanii]
MLVRSSVGREYRDGRMARHCDVVACDLLMPYGDVVLICSSEAAIETFFVQ